MRTFVDPESLELEAEERFELVLTGNAVGGYEWQLADAGGLQLVAAEIESGGELPGAAGSARFTFVGPGCSPTAAVFELRRRWEDEPLRRHRVEVAVRETVDPPGG